MKLYTGQNILFNLLLIIASMQKASLCISRAMCLNRQNGQSLDEYRQNKILPHISEEYQYRITNRLLIEKIIKPRRDKTIIDSLAHTSYNHIYSKKKVFSRNLSIKNNRRKLMRTGTIKYQAGESSKHANPRSQVQSKDNNLQFPKQLEIELQRMNCNKEKSSQPIAQHRTDDHVQCKRMDSEQRQQKDNLNYSRDHMIGKIVRNNSNFSSDVVNQKRPSRQKRFTPKSNRPIITNNYMKQYDNEWERPKQKMKRLIKRIYQPKDKQNNEQALNQY